MAIGLEVVLDDDADRARIERDRMGPVKVFPSWRRGLDSQVENPEPIPIMVVGIPRGAGRRALRMVLHPVPQASPVFSGLIAGDRLVMELDGRPRGHAIVAWVIELGDGLARSDLDAFVLWHAGGPKPRT